MQSQTVLSSAGQPSVPVGSKTSPNTTTTTYGHNSSQTVSSTIASSAHAVTSASRSTNQIDRGRNNRAYPKSVHFSRMPTQQTNSTLQQKTTGYTGRQQSREHTVTELVMDLPPQLYLRMYIVHCNTYHAPIQIFS